jgi:hypothetical protein
MDEKNPNEKTERADPHEEFPDGMSEDVRSDLALFAHGHLKPHLAAVSELYRQLALTTARKAPYHRQTAYALHYLLLAKDAAVRAMVATHKE